MRVSTLLPALLAAVTAAHSSEPYKSATPTPPALTFLYTCFCTCENPLYSSQGPRGIRTAIPIVAGNFTGPRLSGKILDVGADWGVTDPQTGIFSADTRYNFRTDDGANIFVQTTGPAQPDGGLHLRAVLETGDKKYYWLNNIVPIGTLKQIGANETHFELRLDFWHFENEWPNTTFWNGTTYV